MKRLIWFAWLAVGLIAGCASGSGSGSLPISITLGPNGAQNAVAGQAVNVAATVANDSKAAGVTWSLTGPGALSAQTTSSVTYTAPSPISANATATITATSISDSSKTATLTINLQAISAAVSPSSAAPTFGATAAFTATVSNDPGNKGVTWILTQGGTACSPGCGSISPTSTASGMATTYNAPSTPPPSTLTITITATSVADTTKTSSATITVPAIMVAVAPPSANVPVKDTASFTATVTNDTGNKGVTWTLTQGGTACSPGCGTITAFTASGAPAAFTAPATVPANPAVTIGAASVSDSTKTASATATIVGISVSVSPTSQSVVVNGTQLFTATVSNDISSAGVTWTLSQGVTACSPACGTVSPTTGTGNMPSTTYTAPLTVPTPATVTITATSVADTTKSVSTTITVAAASACGSGSESLLKGQYAFLLKGFDSAGNPALVGGVITADGVGHITAGDLDTNLNSGFDSTNGGNPLSVTGSYSVGSDERGCMAITTSGGTQNYRFSLGNISSGAAPVASTGHLIDFDTTGPFTAGVLRKQSGSFANAILKGTYAFGGSSIQNAAVGGGGKFGVVGEIAFNGLGGVTGGSEDFNQNGILDGSAANTTWPANPISIDNNGNYSISNNGRGTLSITFAGGPSPSHSVLYVVSSSEALLMTSDPQTAGTIIAGEAFQQSTGGFSGTSLSGSYVGYSSALGSTAGTTAVDLFLLNASNGNITGTSSQEDGNNFSSSSITATYTVAPKGRTVTAPTGGHPLLLYLVNSTRAFFLGSNGRVESGLVESQTGSSASGTYAFGTPDPQDKSASDDSGVAVFASPNLSVTEDDNSNGSQTPGGMHSFTYSIDSTGLGQVPSGCTISATSTTCQAIFYVISPTKAVIMDAGSTTPKVQVADRQ